MIGFYGSPIAVHHAAIQPDEALCFEHPTLKVTWNPEQLRAVILAAETVVLVSGEDVSRELFTRVLLDAHTA